MPIVSCCAVKDCRNGFYGLEGWNKQIYELHVTHSQQPSCKQEHNYTTQTIYLRYVIG